MTPLKWNTSKRYPRRTTMVIVAWALIVGGLAGLAYTTMLYLDRPTPPQQMGVNVAPAPSSAKPSAQAVDNYTVAPDLPKYIDIPSIGVHQTRIIQLGLMKNNEIATPNNIYDAGWYSNSAKPGQNGAMFIYGHVSNWTSDGVFYNLKKLQSGDRVTITRGDNKTYTYQVVSTKIYDYKKVDMGQVLSPVDPNKPGLNLMTCTGHIIKGTNDFSERIVVFTSLINIR